MVITVRPVWMVEMPVHQVVHVIAVRHPLVSAAARVDVILGMAAAAVLGCAACLVRGTHRQDVIVNVIAVHVMEMPIVEVVGMVAVLDGGVTATGSMSVVVPLVDITGLV